MINENRPSILSPLLHPKQPNFFPRLIDPRLDYDLSRLSFLVPHHFGVYLDEIVSKKRRIADSIRAYRNSGEGLLDHLWTGVEFVGAMDIADRASNGLRQAVIWDNRDQKKESKYGVVLTQAFNNPRFADHNHEHNRRVELILEAMMLNVGELRHGLEVNDGVELKVDSIFPWIDSSLLYAYWHDEDQLLTLQRNFMEGRTNEFELPAKAGHALAVAVKILALHKRYAYERKVDFREAWRICAGAAAMMMIHDPPEQLTQRLEARIPAFNITANGKELIHSTELLDAFEHNQLDIFSISPSQLVELLRMIKKREGFIKTEDENSYGLHPFFEEEYYADLEELANDHEPLLQDLSIGLRKSFNMSAEAAVRADMVDMIAPPVESIFRTINTQRSRNRPFFRNEDEAELLDKILNGKGGLPHEIDSDVRRILWEYAHIEQISKDTVIARNAYVRDLNKDNAIMGLLAFYDIGSHILRGEYNILDQNFNKRIWTLGGKTLRRAIGRVRSESFQLGNKNSSEYLMKVRQMLVKRNRLDLAESFAAKAEDLQQEKREIIASLRKKSPADGYTDNDIKSFQRLINKVLQHVCKQYGISIEGIQDKKLEKYQSRLRKGLYPKSIPYEAYDSQGQFPPSTLVATIQDISLGRIHELYEQLLAEYSSA